MGNNMMNNRQNSRSNQQNVQNIRNNMQNSRNSNNGGNNSNNSNGASCEELMRAIMEADFFATDLKLYLDTHPDDTRAIEMFREAVCQLQACRAAFEESFYPLTATSAGINGEWDWLNGNFPPLS